MCQDSETPDRGGFIQAALSGVRIASVVDPASGIPSWLDTAGATRIELWSERDALTETRAREMTHHAQAIVIDLDWGPSKAFCIAAQVSPCCGVLFTAESIDAVICNQIRRAHWGYRSKRTSRGDFVLALRRLVRFDMPRIDRIAAHAVRMWNLSPQQARVLHYNLWCYCDQDIADALDVSIHTVQEYQEQLRKKTGARSKQAYLARLLEMSGLRPSLLPDTVPRSDRSALRPAVANAPRTVTTTLVPMQALHG